MNVEPGMEAIVIKGVNAGKIVKVGEFVPAGTVVRIGLIKGTKKTDSWMCESLGSQLKNEIKRQGVPTGDYIMDVFMPLDDADLRSVSGLLDDAEIRYLTGNGK
jgi:hypothetical protein